MEVHNDFSYEDKLNKRIHFVLNKNRYLCASLTIGYPYTKKEKPCIFAELKIYEDDHWVSYFDGALLPTYLTEAKLIQNEIPKKLKKNPR